MVTREGRGADGCGCQSSTTKATWRGGKEPAQNGMCYTLVANDGEDCGVRVLDGAHPPTNLGNKFVELVILFSFLPFLPHMVHFIHSPNRKPYDTDSGPTSYYKIRKR